MLPLCKVCMLHVWWFAYYLCVWAASCVCWRGVWEGHHCGRIIMEIAPKKSLFCLPLLFICTPYSFILSSAFIHFHVRGLFGFFSPVWALNISSVLLWATPDTHLEYHRHHHQIALSRFFFSFKNNRRELLVWLKSKFQTASSPCTVAFFFRSGLETSKVWGMEKEALMEIKQATEHEILKMQIRNEFNSISCVSVYDPLLLLWITLGGWLRLSVVSS